ncbi:MAG TPA: biotin transporter BioY [Gemmatimonadales bacterium]|nr:biotin transporter BioY [Gemmatimonadales bacterium]
MPTPPESFAEALAPAAAARTARRVLIVGLAAAVVALSAQIVVPVPFSPVPMTLQPLAVIAIGALLGPAAGAAALVLYLLAGASGLPVFSAGRAGAAWLVGPTGGYLLAFPVAAAVVGALTRTPATADRVPVFRLVLALAAGMIVIHAGGVAHLALLGGDVSTAFRLGFVPFVTGDLLKIGLAGAIVLLLGPALRSRL